jgi:hypothetical protein
MIAPQPDISAAADMATATAIDWGPLVVTLAIVVVVLGTIAYVAEHDVAIAGIGVLGGGLVTSFLMSTSQPWQWAAVATAIASLLFVVLIWTTSTIWGVAAAVIGVFGSLIPQILSRLWGLTIDIQHFPLGVILTALIVIALVALVLRIKRGAAT